MNTTDKPPGCKTSTALRGHVRLLLETLSIRQTANCKPQTANRSLQLRVCSFALPRFQILARRSVQFSSVHFYLGKIYCNTRIHIGIVRVQGSPEETRRLMKPGLPSLKEIISNKQKKKKRNSRSDTLKIGTKQRLS